MKHVLHCIFALALLIAPAILPAQENNSVVRFRSGDNIEIRLGGVPVEEINQVTGAYTVDTKGFVNMPHIGRIRAAGTTQDELQEAIEKAYRDGQIYTRPTITVGVAIQTRFVNVGGEVRMPQRVAYTSDLTVLSAISAAGGFTEFANQGKVRLLRGDEVMTVDIRRVRKDPSKDVVLQPGDSIEVVRSIF
jgi:polysaccharide export outer membrane protein